MIFRTGLLCPLDGFRIHGILLLSPMRKRGITKSLAYVPPPLGDAHKPLQKKGACFVPSENTNLTPAYFLRRLISLPDWGFRHGITIQLGRLSETQPHLCAGSR